MATITKRGDTYRIRVSAGYDINGKQIIKSITWKPDQGMTTKQIEKELERQKVLFEEKCKTGQFMGGDIKLSEYADKWFSDYAEKQLRARTVFRYRQLLERILPALGHIKLCKLQPHHLIEFYANLEEAGIREDIKYKCKIDFNVFLKQKNLTKAGVADKAGVCASVINSISQGKNIASSSASAVCNALGCNCDDIFIKVGDEKPLSSKTILHYHRLLSSMLSTAVTWQIIFSNPCERVKPPKVERSEARYLDETEAARLLELLQNEDIQYQTIIRLLLYTGMRRGELCGLEWSDIDFANSVIHIRRSSLYLPHKGVFEDATKNISSQRSLKTPLIAMDMLKEYRRWQIEQRFKLGDKWENSDRLFTSWNGKPINPDVITCWFGDFIKKNNLPDVSIHSLRHTNATLQIAGGVSLKTVSSRLGHAQLTTTGNIYAHAIRSAEEAAAETIQDILHPTYKHIG